MATVFTHALVGASIAATGPTSSSRARLALAGALLAAAPDLDVVAFRLGIPYEHPLGHRGVSHSLAFAVVAAALVAPLLASRRSAEEILRVTAVLALATASHAFLDALTDGGLGVGLLIPLSDARLFLPWRPLSVSPIGVSAFFRGPGLSILRNEILIVWLPTLLGLWLWQRRRRRAAQVG
ncbi:MAG: metal-dependent hydrolase [Myxococcota bacterium]|nr:metal-dependent hydrolase [Myxococcota bacterium]